MSGVNFELIKKLSEAFGVSGRENEVRDLIKNEIEPYCESVTIDGLGNLIAEKGGEGERLLLTAAMDEPGFIITNIKEGGGAFLDFAAVGAVKPHTVISESVTVGDRKLPGISSLKAVHLTTKEEREKPPALKDLFIDIGADSKAAAEAAVTLGDYAAFKSRYVELGDNRVSGKAIARSACCAVLAALIKDAADRSLTCVFTAQKQTGVRGARLSFGENFKEAVIIDTLEDERAKLGDGVSVPRIVGETCVDSDVAEKLEAAAESAGKLCGFAKKNSVSDIEGISVSGGGIRCAELDIPMRNKNTASEIADKRDIAAAYETLKKYIKDA